MSKANAYIWIFTEGEDDGIESRLPFKIFSTLIVIGQLWQSGIYFIDKCLIIVKIIEKMEN